MAAGGSSSGRVPLPASSRSHAALGDLAPVAALMGADTMGFDSARVNLAVTGPAWQWRLDGGADAHGLAFGGNLANRITLPPRPRSTAPASARPPATCR